MRATCMAFCIYKALGFVLRLIHTDYAKHYIAGHWKTGPKELPAWGGGRVPPPHWKNRGEPGSSLVPTPINFLNLTDWLGVSTVELCARKKRDLGGILRYVWAQKCVGEEPLLPPPPPGEWRGGSPLAPPPRSYANVIHPDWVSGDLYYHLGEWYHAVCLQALPYGTETGSLQIQKDILIALDKNYSVFLVLLDLSAAFDTINYMGYAAGQAPHSVWHLRREPQLDSTLSKGATIK